jgi:hypothetical protein
VIETDVATIDASRPQSGDRHKKTATPKRPKPKRAAKRRAKLPPGRTGTELRRVTSKIHFNGVCRLRTAHIEILPPAAR